MRLAVHVVLPNVASAFIEPLYKLSLCAFPTASLSLSLTQPPTSHRLLQSTENPEEKTPNSPLPSMEKKNAKPIVDPKAVASKAVDSVLDAVPGTDNAAGASAAAGGGRIPPVCDPYEEEPYIQPANPYDACLADPWTEVTRVCSLVLPHSYFNHIFSISS